MTKIISENSVNDFIVTGSFILFLFISFLLKNHVLVYLYRVHNICKYFEFISVHIQK